MTSSSFKTKLRSGELLVGTFIKTASHQTIEIVSQTGLHFVVIDAEHAPFSVNQLDVCLLAAQAHQLPALVRLSNSEASTVLQSLDMGATGLLVPHAKVPHEVRAVTSSAHYRNGTRGFSNSPRAGGYGTLNMASLIDEADAKSTLVFQIEDQEALEVIDELASLPQVDGYLIGRADLAVSLGVFDINAPEVEQAIARISKACQTHQKALGIFVTQVQEIPKWRKLGMSFFIVGSDQSMLKQQAHQLSQEFNQLIQG